MPKPKLLLPGHSDRCNGSMEVHTAHLPQRRGHYQVVYRCACGRDRHEGRVYTSLTKAELAIRDYPIEQLLAKRR